MEEIQRRDVERSEEHQANEVVAFWIHYTRGDLQAAITHLENLTNSGVSKLGMDGQENMSDVEFLLPFSKVSLALQEHPFNSEEQRRLIIF